MKVLMLGCGLMGPAAAYHLLTATDVTKLVIADVSQERLDACMAKLATLAKVDKLSALRMDITDTKASAETMKQFDVILGALSQSLHFHGIQAAIKAGVPLVDIAYFNHALWPDIKKQVDDSGSMVIVGCGVEPGLSEIMSRHLAEKLDRADELHIKVGGLVEKPAPPFGYKIVFGGDVMPWEEGETPILIDGKITKVARYSGLEMIDVPGLGQCEAWNESFFSWMMNVPALSTLTSATQKTVRWPGYAAVAEPLMRLGLLSRKPVDVDGVEVTPKRVVDMVLKPFVTMTPEDRDITVFRVELAGVKNGRKRKYKIEMLDRQDENGFTSMARTTAMTGAIVARMVGRGEIKGSGLFAPEQLIAGPLFDRIVKDLAEINIKFELTEEKADPLGA